MNARVELPPIPGWLAALPFLYGVKSKSDHDMVANSSLGAAAAALAADSERRDSRSRMAFLIAELGAQYGRRTGDFSAIIPVGRVQLARAAEVPLAKAKRVLGFLLLSGVVELGREGIRITDWPRLCELASYDRSWVDLPEPGQVEEAVALQPGGAPASVVTSAGDPANFV